jgi:hypothetical protein
MLALESLTGLVVLDEIQTLSQLFPRCGCLLIVQVGPPGFCYLAAHRQSLRSYRLRHWQAGWPTIN